MGCIIRGLELAVPCPRDEGIVLAIVYSLFCRFCAGYLVGFDVYFPFIGKICQEVCTSSKGKRARS